MSATDQPLRPTRRTVLRGSAAIAVGALATGAATACDSSPSAAEESARALVPLANAALVQQRQAKALAPQLTSYTAALNQVAAERGEHLQALRDEINRSYSSVADSITSSTPAAGSDDPSTALESLRTALTGSANSCTDAASSTDGFRAGLLGSIAASCSVLVKVQLA